MHWYAASLFVTGAILIGASVYFWRHPQSDHRFTHVHSAMSDEKIEDQLEKRPHQGGAGLGVAAGVVFICCGFARVLFYAMLSFSRYFT